MITLLTTHLYNYANSRVLYISIESQHTTPYRGIHRTTLYLDVLLDNTQP